VGVHDPAKIQLPDVVEGGDGLRPGLGLGERGQEHPGQDGDDGDDHEELDQREGNSVAGAVPSAGDIAAAGRFPVRNARANSANERLLVHGH
jgi:hypothetical protein